MHEIFIKGIPSDVAFSGRIWYNESEKSNLRQKNAENGETMEEKILYSAIQPSGNLTIGNYVSLNFSGEAESNHFYIPVSYVRQEKGQYYVMKADENDHLTKQVIQTGKIIYGGYSIEVLSGLSEEDRICFPYGKYVTKGAPVKDGSGTMYY